MIYTRRPYIIALCVYLICLHTAIAQTTPGNHAYHPVDTTARVHNVIYIKVGLTIPVGKLASGHAIQEPVGGYYPTQNGIPQYITANTQPTVHASTHLEVGYVWYFNKSYTATRWKMGIEGAATLYRLGETYTDSVGHKTKGFSIQFAALQAGPCVRYDIAHHINAYAGVSGELYKFGSDDNGDYNSFDNHKGVALTGKAGISVYFATIGVEYGRHFMKASSYSYFGVDKQVHANTLSIDIGVQF